MHNSKLLLGIAAFPLVVGSSYNNLSATDIFNINSITQRKYGKQIQIDDVSTNYSDSEGENSFSEDIYFDIDNIIKNIKILPGKLLQINTEDEQVIISILETIIQKMINAKNIDEYNANYTKLCEVFYEIWKIQSDPKTPHNSIVNIWTTSNNNYINLQRIWKQVFDKYSTNIVQVLTKLIKTKNTEQLSSLLNKNKTNSNQLNKSKSRGMEFRKKLKLKKAINNASDTTIKNIVDNNLKKLDDIRKFIFEYINIIKKEDNISEGLTSNAILEQVFLSKGNTLNGIDIEMKTENEINNEIEDSIKKDQPNIKIYKNEKEKLQVKQEIAEQADMIATMRKMNREQKVQAQLQQISVSQTPKQLEPIQIFEQDLNTIEQSLNNLIKSNNIQKYKENYMLLCKIFYDIWKTQNITPLNFQQKNLLNNSTNNDIKKPDNNNQNTQNSTYVNDGIWSSNNINYKKVQNIWNKICAKYSKTISEKLYKLFEGTPNINQLVNKSLFEFSDIRYFIKDYYIINIIKSNTNNKNNINSYQNNIQPIQNTIQNNIPLMPVLQK